jgi:hypothetical protein
MLTTTARLASLLLFLSSALCALHAQITGGYWVSSQGTGVGVTCHDAQTDLPATCVTHAYCTHPPNPLAAFDIGGQAYATCPNQPVRNVGLTVQKIGDAMIMAAEGKATATAYNRLIKDELRTGDCNGNTVVIVNFTDPYGCDPPPPPPPPQTCCSTGNCQYRFQCNGNCICANASPIIIDVEGEGFHLTSPENGVNFDIGAVGFKDRIGWTDPKYHNAFLVLDRNHDNVIDSGKELFGGATQQPLSDDPNGFRALAVFDLPENGGNGDGIIDSLDSVWSELRLWIDANHDGVSQSQELHRLEEEGVYSIALDYKLSPMRDAFANQFAYKGRVNVRNHPPGDEVDRIIYDVIFTMRVDRLSGSCHQDLLPPDLILTLQ